MNTSAFANLAQRQRCRMACCSPGTTWITRGYRLRSSRPFRDKRCQDPTRVAPVLRRRTSCNAAPLEGQLDPQRYTYPRRGQQVYRQARLLLHLFSSQNRQKRPLRSGPYRNKRRSLWRRRRTALARATRWSSPLDDRTERRKLFSLTIRTSLCLALDRRTSRIDLSATQCYTRVRCGETERSLSQTVSSNLPSRKRNLLFWLAHSCI